MKTLLLLRVSRWIVTESTKILYTDHYRLACFKVSRLFIITELKLQQCTLSHRKFTIKHQTFAMRRVLSQLHDYRLDSRILSKQNFIESHVINDKRAECMEKTSFNFPSYCLIKYSPMPSWFPSLRSRQASYQLIAGLKSLDCITLFWFLLLITFIRLKLIYYNSLCRCLAQIVNMTSTLTR